MPSGAPTPPPPSSVEEWQPLVRHKRPGERGYQRRRHTERPTPRELVEPSHRVLSVHRRGREDGEHAGDDRETTRRTEGPAGQRGYPAAAGGRETHEREDVQREP